MKTMKTTQALESVKIRQYETINFINVLDIPQPDRDAFWDFMQGQGIPVIPGFDAVAFAWDWERWKESQEKP